MWRQEPCEERREVRAQGQQLAVAIGETVELAARPSREEWLVRREVVDHRQNGLAKPARFELVREQPLELAQARRRVEEARRDPRRQAGREPHARSPSSSSTRRPSSTVQVAAGHRAKLRDRLVEQDLAPVDRPQTAPPGFDDQGRGRVTVDQIDDDSIRRQARHRQRQLVRAATPDRRRVDVDLEAVRPRAPGAPGASPSSASGTKGRPSDRAAAIPRSGPRFASTTSAPATARPSAAARPAPPQPMTATRRPRGSTPLARSASTTPSASVDSPSQTPRRGVRVLTACRRSESGLVGAGNREGHLLVRRGDRQTPQRETQIGDRLALDDLEPEVAELLDVEGHVERRQSEGAVGRVVQARRERVQGRSPYQAEEVADLRQLREAVVPTQLGHRGLAGCSGARARRAEDHRRAEMRRQDPRPEPAVAAREGDDIAARRAGKELQRSELFAGIGGARHQLVERCRNGGEVREAGLAAPAGRSAHRATRRCDGRRECGPAARAPGRARLRGRRDRSAAPPRRSGAGATRASPRRRRLRSRCAGCRGACRGSASAASPGRDRRPGRRAPRASRRSRRELRGRGRPRPAARSATRRAAPDRRAARAPRDSLLSCLHKAKNLLPGSRKEVSGGDAGSRLVVPGPMGRDKTPRPT